MRRIELAPNVRGHPIHGVKVFGRDLGGIDLDPELLPRKSNQFHYPEGIDDAALQKGSTVSAPFTAAKIIDKVRGRLGPGEPVVARVPTDEKERKQLEKKEKFLMMKIQIL